MLEELFFEIGMVLVIAALLSMVVFRFRLPLIIAYMITGILVGSKLLVASDHPEMLNLMSQIGVAFLLFTVGLNLNWRTLKEVGGIALATGIGQVVFTTLIGYVIAVLLGFDSVTSLYIAIAFTFASTIVVIKLLSDKEDIDSLYGRISVGFLLVEDFIAMIILLVLNALKDGAPLDQVLVISLVKAFILIPILWFVANKVLPHVIAYTARSQELLFLFAIGWCFLVSGLLYYFGFGIELGALIAGITLSGSIYHREINARIRPLRDFFLIIFFIVLGTHLALNSLYIYAWPIVVFSLFILIGNPLIVLLVMRLLGYHPRTGFLAGTTVAQVSEFSFIIIGAGIASHTIPNSTMSFVTAVGLVTIAGSSLLIQYNERLYGWIHPALRWMEPKIVLEEEMKKTHKPVSVLLFGFHRTGSVLLPIIQKMKKPFAVVDFDPQVIRILVEREIPALYGDVGDRNFLDEIRSEKTPLIISTVPDVIISLSLLHYLKSKKYKGIVIVSAHTHEEAKKCYHVGATYVIVPSALSGTKFAELLLKGGAKKRTWESVRKDFSRYFE